MFSQPWGYSYYYAQPNPNVYSPYSPGFSPYGYCPEIRYSTKYPQLISLLASDTTRLQWDVRHQPSTINSTTFFQHRYTIATQNQYKKLMIISKAFPWSINIESHIPITCEMVWDGLYRALQQPIEDSEWGMLCIIKKTPREAVQKAAKKRRDANANDDQHLRRIDYLGEETIFAGLGKDEEFTTLRSFPGRTDNPDTWVVSFKK